MQLKWERRALFHWQSTHYKLQPLSCTWCDDGMTTPLTPAPFTTPGGSDSAQAILFLLLKYKKGKNGTVGQCMAYNCTYSHSSLGYNYTIAIFKFLFWNSFNMLWQLDRTDLTAALIVPTHHPSVHIRLPGQQERIFFLENVIKGSGNVFLSSVTRSYGHSWQCHRHVSCV